tara:strand:+ start:1292 stop:1843 length:552 start_codon:yes stop_codon:yes gene_type:complete
MALTYSSMLPLGTKLIDFNLPNTISNQNFDSSNLVADKPILLMVICNHCPYVIHYHDELKRLHKDYSESLSFVAISSNDVVNYPEDSPKKMKELWAELNFTFPYLHDETQDIAKAYKAECTPEFYLFSSDQKLVYRGRCDETSPGSGQEPNGKDLRAAIDALLTDSEINQEQFPSMGCNIKWK